MFVGKYEDMGLQGAGQTQAHCKITEGLCVPQYTPVQLHIWYPLPMHSTASTFAAVSCTCQLCGVIESAKRRAADALPAVIGSPWGATSPVLKVDGLTARPAIT